MFVEFLGRGGGGGVGGFGGSESPKTILTKQYSIKAINTNLKSINVIKIPLNFFIRKTYTVHTDMKASTAFRYETGGKDACDFACCVDNVNSDVTPNVTLAGAASGFIQNDIHF